jgi:branched-chain amino acid transport system substrate-binding protein
VLAAKAVQRRRFPVALGAVTVVAALAAGCGGSDSGASSGGGGAGAKAGKPLILGIQTHKTGAVAAISVDKEFGVKAGVFLATKGTNKVAGREVKFVIADDGSDPGKAPQAARQMLQQDRPDLVFGFESSASAVATAPITSDAKIINIFPIAASDDLTAFSPWVFRTSRNAVQEAQMGSSVVAMQPGKTFMILAPDYAYGQSAAKAWESLLKKQGGKQLGSTLFAPLDGKDYTSVIERIRNQKPDVLVVVTFASASGPVLWQSIGNAGIPDQSDVFTLLPQKPVRIAMGPVAQKVRYFAIYDKDLPENDLNKQFVEKFKELSGGKDPDIYAGDSAVAGMLAVRAIESTKGDTSPDALRKALETAQGESVKGAYRVRPEDHTFLQTFYEAKVGSDGNATLVKEFSLEDSEIPIGKRIEG